MLHPKHFLSPREEKARYETHNNCPDDMRYQQFVSPIVESIMKAFEPTAKGLDFGAGTGPVITKMLTDAGYSMELYDPFFHDNPEALELKYDFIVCCEVIEHFHHPFKEFTLLRSLLKPKGILYCKTELISENLVFENWYYKNDPTHVFFYHNETLRWIRKNLLFTGLQVEGRVIEFTA
jgi:2-polyprenyl-3-methyl-5-hydroxy-6-metoxy-1,4-benzoquinol methylase